MTEGASNPAWAQLFRIAYAQIRQVNACQMIIDRWTFGGGTAMMLQIGHRESRDVDIFLPDPQFLQFLDPQKYDFQFEIEPEDHGGDGARFIKLAFDELGEIDYIVAQDLTSNSAAPMLVENETVLVETVPEIITKKVYYRGANIKPRDIFDIAAGSEQYEDAIIEALKGYERRVKETLSTIEKLNPEFVNHAIADLAIRADFEAIARTALERAKAVLGRVIRD